MRVTSFLLTTLYILLLFQSLFAQMSPHDVSSTAARTFLGVGEKDLLNLSIAVGLGEEATQTLQECLDLSMQPGRGQHS